MSRINRRTFLRRGLAAGVTGAAVLSMGKGTLAATPTSTPRGTLIDLTLCDGCPNDKTPRCVSACRQQNEARFPQPQQPIPVYWPKKTNEDWSDKKDLTSRLTPYNWTYVQKVDVEWQGHRQSLFVPRRCMHCDNPPCVSLCPYSAQTKKPEGPVVIDDRLCLGGAKCRDVCPWGIPSRQAGVGLYMNLAGGKYAGGGVMYKCDLCYDRVRVGSAPACVEACPKKAIVFGDKEAMRAEAHRRAKAIGGHIYGEKENGGTSTFYVSAVPFEAIHKALMEQAVDGKPGRPAMPVGVGNYMDTVNGMALGALVAPVAGLVAAGVAAYRTLNGKE
jgi:Fe-S-cluster-containing dehydrogenase component